MRNRTLSAERIRGVLALLLLSLAPSASHANDATDLLFRDFYEMPVGPLGLQPSSKLVGLDGRIVRVRGYMVREEAPLPGVLILSPLPIELGDADESLSDDLPPAVIFVHFDEQAMPYVTGVVQLTGTLSVGPQNEADGHVSQVRLMLDTPSSTTR